jgi:TonB family protein
MGYQALLFCPDERTARTVTQVLAELEFAVTPCTEPFAAVKKLMGEHFDAVVVDCDNEQNATLLFKSARNAPNNQSALAVAVVEGQAGVAKAFRIGANLVLTKPINVDQAKGTLRVARGLLRKGETTKPAAAPAATTTVQPAAPVPMPPKTVPQAPIQAVPKRPTPIAPLATAAAAGISTRKPTLPPTVVASAPVEITEVSAEPTVIKSIAIASEETTSVAKPEAHASAPEIDSVVSTPAKAESKIKIETAVSHPLSPAGFGTGAASAPAPAREAQPSVSIEDKPSAVISERESASGEVAASASSASAGETAAPSSFTFGGNVSNSSGRGKKVLLAVVAVVLVAIGGYEAWLQWNASGGYATTPVLPVTQRATTPVAVPQKAPNAAQSASSSNPSSVVSSVPNSTAVSQPSGLAVSTSDAQASDVPENPLPHASKGSSGTDSLKPAVSVVAANKAPATPAAEQPILIKNGHSRPTVKTTEAGADEPVPSVTAIAAAGNGGTLPSLMGGASNAPTPVLQTVNVSQGVSRGLLVKTVQPAYPSIALRMRTEGPVELMATITKSGNISAVKVLSGDAGLAHAAAEAVKQWKYKPYLLNGEPVEIQTQVTVIFKLPK